MRILYTSCATHCILIVDLIVWGLLYPYERIYTFSTETDVPSEKGVHTMKEDDVIALKIDHWFSVWTGYLDYPNAHSHSSRYPSRKERSSDQTKPPLNSHARIILPVLIIFIVIASLMTVSALFVPKGPHQVWVAIRPEAPPLNFLHPKDRTDSADANFGCLLLAVDGDIYGSTASSHM